MHDADAPAAAEHSARARRFPVRIAATAAVAAGIAVTLIAAPAIDTGRQRAVGQAAVGTMAPDFTLLSLASGDPIRLSGYRGQVVVVNFWASWCDSCRGESAVLVAAAHTWRSRGVVFLGVDAVDDTAAARQFTDSYGVTYDSAVDSDGTVSAAWGVTGYPHTFVVDAEGRIVSHVIAAIDAPTLDSAIAMAFS